MTSRQNFSIRYLWSDGVMTNDSMLPLALWQQQALASELWPDCCSLQSSNYTLSLCIFTKTGLYHAAWLSLAAKTHHPRMIVIRSLLISICLHCHMKVMMRYILCGCHPACFRLWWEHSPKCKDAELKPELKPFFLCWLTTKPRSNVTQWHRPRQQADCVRSIRGRIPQGTTRELITKRIVSGKMSGNFM